jgi:hypothetical protein
MFCIELGSARNSAFGYWLAVLSELRSLCLRHLRSLARSDSSSPFCFTLVLIAKPEDPDE